MVPINNLMGGVGLAICILIFRNKKTVLSEVMNRKLIIILPIYFILITFYNLAYGLASILPDTRIYSLWFDFSDAFDSILILCHIIVGLLFLRNKKMNGNIKRWILISICISIVKSGLNIIIELFSPVVYRFYGILDFMVIFCWMVIIDKIMVKRFQFGISTPKYTALR